MRVFVQLRDSNGSMVGVDMWGNVLDCSYDAVENAVTIRHGDGSGVRRKWYGSGTYGDVVLMQAGGSDSAMFPADAAKEHS